MAINKFLVEDRKNCLYYVITTEKNDLDEFESIEDMLNYEPGYNDDVFIIETIDEHYIF